MDCLKSLKSGQMTTILTLKIGETALMAMPALMAFIPMIMGTAGNAGGQASVLIIRNMAIGDVCPKDILKVLWREMRIGILCGIALGIVNSIRVYFFSDKNPLLVLTLTLTLMGVVVFAKSLGCLLPVLAKKIKLDPTVMATPLLTTIADASSLLLFFVVASWLMGI